MARGVADEADVDRAVLAELRGIAIDLDDLGRGVDAGAVADAEVERRADDDDAVGVAERLFAREVERVRVRRRERAAPHAVHDDRDADAHDHLAQHLGGVVPPDLRADEQHRLLGAGDELAGGVDERGIGRRDAGSDGGRDWRQLRVVDLRGQDVERQLDEHRPAHARVGVADGGGDVSRAGAWDRWPSPPTW